MILLLHIITALASLAASTFAVLKPSADKIKLSYALVAGTIISGTVLVIASHSPLLSSCIAGLAYVSVSMGLVLTARRRLLSVSADSRD